MKSITQERVIKVAENLQTRKSKALIDSGAVVCALALRGLQSCVGINSEADDLRLDLELTFREVSANPIALSNLLNDWKFQIHRWCRRADRIGEIQAKYNVSGLVPATKRLGDRIIERLWQHEMLWLIEDDLPKLRQQKERIFSSWLDCMVSNGLQTWIYRRSDSSPNDWFPANLAEIKSALPFYDWLNFWDRGNGAHREIHLFMGSGLSTDGPSSSTWICACSEKPML